MIPADLTVIPSFVLVRDLGWLNTWQGLIVPGLANGIIIFLFRQFFAEIPQDLIDAPRVDGATWLQVFTTDHLAHLQARLDQRRGDLVPGSME